MSNPDNNRPENFFLMYQEHTNAQGTSKQILLDISSGSSFHNPGTVTEDPEVINASRRDHSSRLRTSRGSDRSLTHNSTTSPNYDTLSSPPRRNSSIPSEFKSIIDSPIPFELKKTLLEDVVRHQRQQETEEYEKYKEAAIRALLKYESYFKEVDPNFRYQKDPLINSSEFQSQGYEKALKKTIHNLQEQLQSIAEIYIRHNEFKSNQLNEDIKIFKNELAEIQSETNRANDSSTDIKNALSTQQPNLEENNDNGCQCFQDLKCFVRKCLAKEGIDDDQTLKEIIQDMLTVTKYHSVESDLQKIEELFKNSGREKWINQIRLQVVSCYVKQETSVELINEFVSKLNPNIQYGDLDKVYCVRKADRLSKYALAKDHYYGGEYSYDRINTLYFEFPTSSGSKNDQTQHILQSNAMNPQVTNIETDKPLPAIDGAQLSHPLPLATPHNTADVDIVRLPSPPVQFTLEEWKSHSSFGKDLCKKCSWCKHKKDCRTKICMRCDQLREHKDICQKYSKKKSQLCGLCKDAENSRRKPQHNA